ncbi:MAG: preprotein translocase subunit SecE [Propioniciclava sp.]|uniref:preprotein translocase subunit SecE n=1 Tax=Propioniciclava sp. TaxID=2038686 RepID=UPI0039E5A400
MAPNDDSYESLASPANDDDALNENTDADGVPATAPSVAEQARGARPVRKSAATAEVAKKGAATPRRRATHDEDDAHRAGPVQFVGESVDELKKVVWPTWPQVQQYFWAVLVFVLIVMGYVGLLDLGFGWLMLKLFG